MKYIFYILFIIVSFNIHLEAQTYSLMMHPYPPTTPADWLKEPQPISLIINNPFGQNKGARAKISVRVTKGGQTAVTNDIALTPEFIIPSSGSLTLKGTQLLNESCLNVVPSLLDITSGSLKVGDYQICVKIVTPTGTPLGTSTQEDCKPFTITEYQEPTLTYPYNNLDLLQTSAYNLMFMWTPITPSPTTFFAKYRFELYEIPSGMSIIQALNGVPIETKEVNQTSFTWANAKAKIEARKKEGETLLRFAWRVRSLDNNSKPIGRNSGVGKGYSETRFLSITLKDNNAYNPPSLVYPFGNATIASDTLSKANFEWNPVMPNYWGVLKYRIKIFQLEDNNTQKLVVNESVNGTKFTWANPKAVIDSLKAKGYTSQKFTWSVQAWAENAKESVGKNNGFSEIRDFSVVVKNASSPTPTTTTEDAVVEATEEEENTPAEPEAETVIQETTEESKFTITTCDGKTKTISNKGLAIEKTAESFKNKFVKINSFPMLITNCTGNSSSLSGDGTIVVPWLLSPIAVQFNNIKIGSNMKVTEGEVLAKVSDDAKQFPKSWSMRGTMFAKWTTKKVAELSKFLKDKNRLTSNFNFDAQMTKLVGDNTPKLPIGINNVNGYTVAINEMKFTPQENTLICVAIVPFQKGTSNETLAFAAYDVKFSMSKPVAGGGKLGLLEDLVLSESTNTESYEVRLKAKDPNSSKSGSYIEWGCKGFEKLQASVEVAFPRAWMKPIPDNNKKVTATTTAEVEKLNDWLLTINLGDCQIEGVDEVKFSIKDLVFDHSDTRNAEEMEFPEDYIGTKGNDFRGFYLKAASLSLPKFYTKSGGGEVTAIVRDVIINKFGVNANTDIVGVLSAEEGSIGDFQGSIDTFNLQIVNSSVKSASITGEMVLPLANRMPRNSNSFNYVASWSKSDGVQFVVEPSEPIDVEFLGGATLNLDENSSITMTYQTGQFTANVSLNGNMKLSTKLKDKYEVDMEMGFQNIGFTYDNKLQKPFKFNKPVFAFASPQKKLANFPISLSNVTMSDDGEERAGYLASAALQFDVNVNFDDKVSGTTTLKVVGGLKKDAKGRFKSEFVEVKLNAVAVEVNMAAVSLKGSIEFFDGDEVYGDGFKGELEANFQKAGTLTANVQFGNTKPRHLSLGSDYFRYWYVEGKVILRQGVPIVDPLYLKGMGVGAWYHMTSTELPQLDATEVADATADTKETKSGATFTPDNQTLFGFSIKGIMMTKPSERTFNGDITISAEFNNSGGINLLKILGEGYVGERIKSREKAPIKGTIEAKYDFTQDIFDLNVKIDIKYPKGAPLIETREPATMSFYIDGRNKKWALNIGTPTAPNKVRFLSLPTWAYFRAGNDLPYYSGFQPETMNGLAAAGLNTSSLNKVNNTENSNIKNGNGFDFGVGFHKGGSVSLGPFSGSYNVGAELNLSMLQYPAEGNDCLGDGFNYWYARGNMAAYANADVRFRILGRTLAGAGFAAAAMMEGGGPDPLWIRGSVAGQFRAKILFIKIRVRARIPFSYGTPCRPTGAIVDSDTETDLFDDNQELIETVGPEGWLVDKGVPYYAKFTYRANTAFVIETVENGVPKERTFSIAYKTKLNGQPYYAPTTRFYDYEIYFADYFHQGNDNNPRLNWRPPFTRTEFEVEAWLVEHLPNYQIKRVKDKNGNDLPSQIKKAATQTTF